MQIGWSFSPQQSPSRTSLASAATPPRERRSENSEASQDRFAKEFEALEKLKQLPRKSAEDKAAMLVKRLKELKALIQSMMMFGASAAQIKSIAREIKSIAGQLSDAAKQLSGATTGATGVPNIPAASLSQAARSKMPEVEASQATHDSEGKAADAEATASQAVAAASSGTNEQPQESQERKERRGGGAGEGDDSALRETLIEARKLLKELIDNLKSIADKDDRDTRSQLKNAEEQLRKLDNRLMDSLMPKLYGARGIPTADTATLPALNGGSLSVKV
ncbi:hypothetical protein [Kushneria aurantia]|uniref:Uncharacterized protein n=1 Tax=Kushneria aurantia TaxID=504092 RepID=A0ABV6FYM4_9GAMM|nr:hypothetical protein [Kushneria aurantia]